VVVLEQSKECCVFHPECQEDIDDALKRITALEIKDARYDERFITLCGKMDDVMNTLRDWMAFAQALFWKVLGASGVIIVLLLGFFIWYIQSLPRV